MKTALLTILCFLYSHAFTQKTEARLSAAYESFAGDAQFKHAIISLYVVDSKTGKPLFDKNAQLGLAPASTLKVVTSAAAFELLGKDHRYKTNIGHDGTIMGNRLNGNLIIQASGDPTLGSWRWEQTKMDTILKQVITVLKANKITSISGDIVIDETNWSTQATPRGWTWDDMGNYYGAGARAFNWHENQYDLVLKPGKNMGDPVEVLRTEPELQVSLLVNELKTGRPGSGDNSVIYLPEDGVTAFVRGTVEGGGKDFTVSGSMPNAAVSFVRTLQDVLHAKGITLDGRTKTALHYLVNKEKIPVATKQLTTIYSPSLDSINYWFLQKSVNLFGEAFVKTIALQKAGIGSTDTGINIIKNFWAANGIDKPALKIIDGSGLSPANRVTAHALVSVMQYARQKSWFASFNKGLPEQNGIKMKSGYIGGVRSYTGYVRSMSGTEYTFAFIINNFDGSPGTVREKMWRVLDVLKTL